MAVNKDFEDLLHHFNAAGVNYLIVGAYAVIAHAEPRYTKDIDIWVKPSLENAQKVRQTLKRFGAPTKNLTLKDLTNPAMVYQIGIAPNRIDILMGVGKLSFDRAWKNRKDGKYGKEKIAYLGFGDLVQTKKATRRPHDMIDLEILSQAAKRKRRRPG